VNCDPSAATTPLVSTQYLNPSCSLLLYFSFDATNTSLISMSRERETATGTIVTRHAFLRCFREWRCRPRQSIFICHFPFHYPLFKPIMHRRTLFQGVLRTAFDLGCLLFSHFASFLLVRSIVSSALLPQSYVPASQ